MSTTAARRRSSGAPDAIAASSMCSGLTPRITRLPRNGASAFESSIANRLELADNRPAHRDAVALAARERARPFVQRLHGAKDAGRVCHPRLDLSLRKLPHPKREPHVPGRRHVGVEGVVLEDHRNVAIFRGNLVDDLAADPDLAVGDVLEPGDHPQRAGLAAAGRADQNDELTVRNLQIERIDGLGAVGIDLRQLLELDLGHAAPAKRLESKNCTSYRIAALWQRWRRPGRSRGASAIFWRIAAFSRPP